MLGASLLVHGGIVGIAAILWQPEPETASVVIDIFPEPDDPASGVPMVPSAIPTETAQPTAKPEDIVPSVPTPPEPSDSPDFAPPSTPIPPTHRLTAARPATAAHPTTSRTNSQLSPGQPNGSLPAGTNGGSTNVLGVWVMPHPPYPRALLSSNNTGTTTVRITTDASGRVSNVVIVKSTGNPMLDNVTENYVREHWHGPANASRTTEFVYQIK